MCAFLASRDRARGPCREEAGTSSGTPHARDRVMTITPTTSGPITGLLHEWTGGDQSALAALLPIVDAELRRLARRQMRRERPDHTLQTSALINEAYLRLGGVRRMQWRNRTHF